MPNPSWIQIILVVLISSNSFLFAQEGKKISFDIIGFTKYSTHNFTDAVIPYYALDSWFEFRTTFWVNNSKRFSPYLSVLGSHMGYIPKAPDDIITFFWQKYIQGRVGAQFYPFYEGDYNPWFGFRIFAFGAARCYYSKEKYEVPYSNLEEFDFHAGADYYYDNLICNEEKQCKNKPTIIAWSSATYRVTNFREEGYNNMLWTGNVKGGFSLSPIKHSILFPYAVVDWTWIPFCGNNCDWWENYLRYGMGFQFYPRAYNSQSKPSFELLRRFHIYLAVLNKGIWLSDSRPEQMHNWDLRFGFGFSTPGFFRKRKIEKN